MSHDSFDDECSVDWRMVLPDRTYLHGVSHDPYDEYVPQFSAPIRDRALMLLWIAVISISASFAAVIAYSYLR